MGDEKTNGFNVEEFLTTTSFTIPVELTEPKTHVGTTPKTRRLMVTYNFDDEISDKVQAGKMVEEEVDDPENPDQKKKVMVKKALTINDQLVLLVTEIEGVTSPLTEELWQKSPFKYRDKILDTIMRDIYPNVKTSTG